MHNINSKCLSVPIWIFRCIFEWIIKHSQLQQLSIFNIATKLSQCSNVRYSHYWFSTVELNVWLSSLLKPLFCIFCRYIWYGFVFSMCTTETLATKLGFFLVIGKFKRFINIIHNIEFEANSRINNESKPNGRVVKKKRERERKRESA